MKKIFRDQNYIVIDDGSTPIIVLPATSSIYSHVIAGEDREEAAFLISGNGIRFTIFESEINSGDWQDDAANVYTIATLTSFLRINTGY